MMTEPQRIDYLVSALEGGNAKAFANKAGMHQQTVTGLRQGKYHIDKYVTKILAAYPDVDDKWLVTGDGDPLVSIREKGEVLRKLEALEKEIGRLTKLVERMAAQIDDSSMFSSIGNKDNTQNNVENTKHNRNKKH